MRGRKALLTKYEILLRELESWISRYGAKTVEKTGLKKKKLFSSTILKKLILMNASLSSLDYQ